MRPGDRDLGDFLVQEVLPRLTVEAVYTTVKWTKQRGRYWRGPCPIHGGDNPTAFSVDTETKGWTCFTHCGSGSAVAYMNGGTTPRGRDFVDKVKELAVLAGVPFPERERTEAEVRRAEERDRRAALLESFLVIVQGLLMEDGGEDAHAYLTGRGLGDTIGTFGFYSTRDAVRKALASKGFTKDEVEASGVVYDPRWEGRLVIPWRDRWGHLGTFAARDFTGKALDKGDKYLYLSTGKGWGRGKADLVAYGLDVALRSKADPLVLVEGLLDVVNLQAHGYAPIIAIGGNGKEMTSARWEALAALGVSAVTLALDKDESGVEGTLKAVENVHKVRKVRKVPVVEVLDPVHLGDCKDPDELVRKNGVDAFRSLLEKREPAAYFVGRSFLGDVTPESPVRVREDAAAKLAAYTFTLGGERSALEVENLVRLVSERTGYSGEALLDVAKRHEERRRREDQERFLDEALQKARLARGRGEDPLTVSGKLADALVSVKVQSEDAPPAFSVDRLEKDSKKTPAGKPSGWSTLDSLEVSFNPGELAVLGARTGHCKTSALVGLLRNWAEASGDEVLVLYSQEEPEVRIFHRLLVLLAAEWTAAMVRDYLRDPNSRDFWPSEDALNTARETLRKWESRLLVVSRPAWTVEDLDAHARDLASRRNVGAVLVDYLQRVPPPPGRYDRRDIEVSAVARRLKALAVALAVPVVVGAQINREAVPSGYRAELNKKRDYEDAKETIKKARPDLYHLREGGAEQEADLVLGLLNYAADYRTDGDSEERRRVPDVTRLEVGTLKNRYGVPGRWAALAFKGRCNLIRDAYKDEV